MRVAWVIPCRYLEVNGNLATIVGAGIDRVWLPELPMPIQVLCAVRIIGGLHEVDEEEQEEPEHTLACRVHSPAMELLSELEDSFGMAGSADEPGIDPAVIIPVGVVFEAQEEGTYTIEIAVDGRGISVPLTVKIGQP
ncbi:MAG: hypothetical protein JWM47_4558 [Acidimicrobiales bacterium]|nr:hypothetical protein [Acidimicrobiales bacterium]